VGLCPANLHHQRHLKRGVPSSSLSEPDRAVTCTWPYGSQSPDPWSIARGFVLSPALAAPAVLTATMSPPPSQPFSYSQPFIPPSQPTVKQEDQFEQLMSQIQALTATVSTLAQAQASAQGQNRRECEPCWYCGEPKYLSM
jgi:hypothetical protein